ncbi:MAG: hypothetical protein VB108_07710 [Anaerolineaceae bacterium]|nr:hypothetical protein [Anaerolineaceae bacterium]
MRVKIDFVPELVQIKRNESLELISLGLMASGIFPPAPEEESQRISELIQAIEWPQSVTQYFKHTGIENRPSDADFSKARSMLQAVLFTRRPYESFELEDFLKEADRANLTRNWAEPAFQALLHDLPSALLDLCRVVGVEEVNAAFGFIYQTQFIKYQRTAEQAELIIHQFSDFKPAVKRLWVIPIPIFVPGETFISKGDELYLTVNQPSHEAILNAYLHLALQPYRMQFFELSWRYGSNRVVDLSAQALKGHAREQSLEGTIRLVEDALVKCLSALILPGTIAEKRERLLMLDASGYTAARLFAALASFPLAEQEISAYLAYLQHDS